MDGDRNMQPYAISVKDDASLSSGSSGLSLASLPDHLRFNPSDADQSTCETPNSVAVTQNNHQEASKTSTQLPASGVTVPVSDILKKEQEIEKNHKERYSTAGEGFQPRIERTADHDLISLPSSPQIYRMAQDRAVFNHLGFYHRFGTQHHPQDLRKAYNFYMESANMGSSDALAYLGTAYAYGLGVEKLTSKAHECLRRGILQGSADAVELKALYSLAGTLDGQRDEDKFLMLLELGAHMNSPGCLMWTGLCFEIGIGVPPDPRTAKKAYLSAASSVSLLHLVQVSFPGVLTAGDPWLQLKCALFLLHCIGHPDNLGHAMDCLKQAALLGCKEAQVYLALCLSEGKWLRKSTELALYWYREAAKGDCGQPIAKRVVANME
ncbi:hypothetical protein FGB62_87g084 [Gracilaria domingensis]|nr:hypothetical protein FGB62_87g084 [Gracilaria domingensis]